MNCFVYVQSVNCGHKVYGMYWFKRFSYPAYPGIQANHYGFQQFYWNAFYMNEYILVLCRLYLT